MTPDLHQLSAAYALDALDADELTRFEEHLASCPTCTADIADFVEVAGMLAQTSSAAPPMRLKAAVMSKLPSVDQVVPEAQTAPVVQLADRRRRRFSVAGALATAAAIAILAVGAIVISGTRGGSGYDDVVAAPDAQVVELAGETGTVAVVWSPERDQVALRGDGLEDLDPTLKYALWAIADGNPNLAGLFDARDGRIRDVADLGDVDPQAWGITIEPAGGSDTPTGDIIYSAGT